MVVSESNGEQELDFYIDLNGGDDFVDANEHVFTDLGDVDDVWPLTRRIGRSLALALRATPAADR